MIHESLQQTGKMRKTLVLLFLLISVSIASAQTDIYLDSTTRYQTIDGWEAVSNPMESPPVRDSILPHIDSLLDIAINDVGITRLRYSLKSGVEDTVDYFTLLRNGEITYEDYKQHRYSKINDNDDAFDINPSGFQFSGFQNNLDRLIIPFKNMVEANGDPFYLNLCFVDFKNQSDFHHTSDPEEYAEFMTAAWQFMDSMYHFTPNGLEVILEPDNSAIWNNTYIPPSIVATGNRLSGLGYSPEIIAPSVLSIYKVPDYVLEIAKNEKAMSMLNVISYHRYKGNNDTAAQQKIVDLANQYRKKTAMLEYDKNSDVGELHYDLKHNNVTAWTKYALMYKANKKFAYVFVDATDPLNIEYGIGNQTKYLRQYFKFIRPEAIRIEAHSTNPAIDPVAFINTSDNQVVVIKTEEGDSIRINGLRPDEYSIKYTLGNFDHGGKPPREYDVDLPKQSILPRDVLSFYMPAKGVATVFGLNNETITSVSASKKNANLSVYPNPASDYVMVKNNATDKIAYKIISMQGEVVKNGQIRGNASKKIDISWLPGGVYLIKNKEKAIKLIKMGE